MLSPPSTGWLPSLHAGVSLLPPEEPGLMRNCPSGGIPSPHTGAGLRPHRPGLESTIHHLLAAWLSSFGASISSGVKGGSMILTSCPCYEDGMRKCMLSVWKRVRPRGKPQWMLALLLLIEGRESVVTCSHSYSAKSQNMAAMGIS